MTSVTTTFTASTNSLVAFALLVAFVVQGAGAQISHPGNYAVNAPGTQFVDRGVRFYRQGDFEAAYGSFEMAARWADKLAQFNLGLMHVNGQHVPRNPLRGWAWIKLSAERGYPKYVTVANDIFDQLSDEHRKAAQKILEQELEPEFGDAVAIRRTSRAMKRAQIRKTAGGSRVGANRAIYVTSRDETFVSGEQFFKDDLWDFEKIVQIETRLYKALGGGNVILRDFETIDGPPDEDSDAGDSRDADGEDNRDDQ